MKTPFWKTTMRSLSLAAMLVCLSSTGVLFAQDYDDDDLGFESTTDYTVASRDVAEITLNGELVTLSEEMVFEKNATLDILVRYLRPSSRVEVDIYKAGKLLKKHRFFANEKGELNLEITSGDKKIGGTAKIRYTASSGKRISEEVHIAVR